MASDAGQPGNGGAPPASELDRPAQTNYVIGQWEPWYPRFALLRKLSSGSEGDVWLAEETGGGPVALKIHWGTDGPLREPFDTPLRERMQQLEALAGVMGDIPGLVRCRSPFVGPRPVPPGVAQGTPDRAQPSCLYLPMEFVPGTTLARAVEQIGPLDADRALDARWGLLAHVQHLHETLAQMRAHPAGGLVHGDVAARNVVLGVLPRQVGDATGGRASAQRGVGAVMVVEVQPLAQGRHAGGL